MTTSPQTSTVTSTSKPASEPMGLMWPTNLHERIVQRQRDALFHGDLEAYCSPFTEDAIFADPAAPGVLRGAAEIKPFIRRLLAQFDDCESFGLTRRKFYTYSADERDPQTRVAMVFRLSYRTQDDELVHIDGVDVFEFRGEKIARLTSYYHPLPLESPDHGAGHTWPTCASNR